MRKLLITSVAVCSLSGFALVAAAPADEDLVIRKGAVVGSPAAKAPAESVPAAKVAPARPSAAAAESVGKSERIEPKRIEIAPAEGQSLAAAWDVWFADWKKGLPQGEAAADRATAELERNLRETARRLVAEAKYDEAVAALEAGMRNGEPRPWMYEALSVAMQAAGSSRADLERALMSAADLGAGDVDHFLYLAHYMTRVGLDRRALAMFRDVAEFDPTHTDALIAAMATAERLGDADSIRWATVAVLGQEWTSKESNVAHQALRQAQSLLARLGKEDPAEAAAYQKEIDEARARDLVIRVSWTGDADVDISVLEPTGTVCSFRQPRTTGGGVI
ncbi:MAG: hypothetical protein WD875_13115, partial [Pirellulales bacterium]